MLMDYIRRISFFKHLLIALGIRLVLVSYSEIHDQNAEVLYTDVDYEVVTDGARHILENRSPFQRHTFRYSPILALILTPNVYHKSFGKILFSLFDIVVGILIYGIVKQEMNSTFQKTMTAFYKNNTYQVEKFYKNHDVGQSQAKYSALFWLYNPLSMSISTRGNGDSFSCFFVLATIYFLQKYQSTSKHTFYAGLFHGIAIHLRLYPIVFSLAYFLSISETNQKIYNLLTLRFSAKQWTLILGTLISLSFLTGIFYYLYGYEYIFEAYLYHFIRKDTRHNFSILFLTQYLNINENLAIFEKILISLPQFVVIFYTTFTLGKDLRTLSFCIFVQTFIVVAYNSVVTSQYFLWYLALFPLCLKNLTSMPKRLGFVYFILWILAQALWLLPAYLLEFKSINTFNFIGVQGVAFFFVKIYLIQRLIKYFDFVNIKRY